MAGFLGMRGTGDWETDERPKSWRQGLLYEYPNGKMPLTAITSMAKSERVTDPEFNWWTKGLATQAGAISGVYTDSLMSQAYSSGAVSGDVLYIKVALDTAKQIRAGHQVLLRDSSNPDVDVNGKALTVVYNGSSSMISVQLLENDNNSLSNDLSDADRILVIGNINAEGAPMPDAISYAPTKYTNYCGIFRTPLSITRTARKTKLRTVDQYREAKREALELHGIEMEKNWFWSVPTENTGANNKPERTTGGLNYFLKTYASSNIMNYVTDSDFSGKTWLQGGEDWLDESLEVIFRNGSQEKLGVCGSGVILAIQKLAKANGNIQLKSRQVAYGISITEWVTPFGILYLKTHPLFSYEQTDRNTMFVIDTSSLVFKYVDDTFFKADDSEKKGGPIGLDATNEEYLTEAGFEFHNLNGFGKLTGFGSTNTA